MNTRILISAAAAVAAVTAAIVVFAGAPQKASETVNGQKSQTKSTAAMNADMQAIEKQASEVSVGRIERTEAEWRGRLSPEQFRILREEGTERAFTGAYHAQKEPGLYVCAGCGLPLFSSTKKYDSGTGWPSYWAPIDPSHVKIVPDTIWGMAAEEVECARCGGHQGHVFDDGPQPTGLRYCINSASLAFVPAAEAAKANAKK